MIKYRAGASYLLPFSVKHNCGFIDLVTQIFIYINCFKRKISRLSVVK